MFTIKIVQTFPMKAFVFEKINFKNACFGFQISRVPPSWRRVLVDLLFWIKGKPLNNNDHNQVFWARETEHPKQTIV